MIAGPIPDHLRHLHVDARGLPVPWVAAWSSEHWDIARFDPYVKAVALFTAGRYGRGRPAFDTVNEPRQREAVMGWFCQVCHTPLPRDDRPGHKGRPIGFLPATELEADHAANYEGAPVTSEPLLCEACAFYIVDHCCVLAKRPSAVVKVTAWRPLAQFIDPSAGPPKHERRFDKEGDLQRLGRIARRQPKGGLVGLVKVVVDETEPA